MDYKTYKTNTWTHFEWDFKPFRVCPPTEESFLAQHNKAFSPSSRYKYILKYFSSFENKYRRPELQLEIAKELGLKTVGSISVDIDYLIRTKKLRNVLNNGLIYLMRNQMPVKLK